MSPRLFFSRFFISYLHLLHSNRSTVYAFVITQLSLNHFSRRFSLVIFVRTFLQFQQYARKLLSVCVILLCPGWTSRIVLNIKDRFSIVFSCVSTWMAKRSPVAYQNSIQRYRTNRSLVSRIFLVVSKRWNRQTKRNDRRMTRYSPIKLALRKSQIQSWIFLHELVHIAFKNELQLCLPFEISFTGSVNNQGTCTLMRKIYKESSTT